MSRQEPHAYGVEVLVNAGLSSEYWRLEMDEDPRDTEEGAEDIRDMMLAEGYRLDHLRIVALTVVRAEAKADAAEALARLKAQWQAEERERIAQAIEVEATLRARGPDSEWETGTQFGLSRAARIARTTDPEERQ